MVTGKVLLAIAAVLVSSTIVYHVLVNDNSDFRARVEENISEGSKIQRTVEPGRIRVVSARSLAIVNDTCTTGQVAGLRFPICTYTPEQDPVVSTYIQSGRYWEPDMVSGIIDIVRKYPSAIFIDIGTNVGAYSIAIAHLGRRVICVEPNIETMRHLATSVDRGNISSQVKLLLNAVSNQHATLHLGVDVRNRGDSFLLPASFCSQHPNSSECRRSAVQTITLDDLLTVLPSSTSKLDAIIKVDAQGSELSIFDPETAAAFFRRLNVVAMQIEWNQTAREAKDDARRKRNGDRVIEFLRQQNFTVHPVLSQNVLEFTSWTSWPPDVLFVRRS